jgi:hypothetical protein
MSAGRPFLVAPIMDRALHGAEGWKMAVLLLTRDEEDGALPDACMCCGAPATDWSEQTFLLQPPEVHGPSGFATVHAARMIHSMASAPRMRLKTSFCPEHRHYWTIRLAVVFGGLAGLFLVLFAGIAVVAYLFAVVKVDAPWPAACVIVPLALYLTVWLILVSRYMADTIRARLTEGGAVVLLNVGERYVAAVEAARQG